MMRKIIILNSDNIYKKKVLFSNKNFNLFLELLSEIFLAQLCLEPLEENIARKLKKGCETISIRFDIMQSGKILLTSIFDKNQEQKIELTLNFLKKVITDWVKIDESRYKKIILYIDLEKEIFEFEVFKELSREDKELLKEPIPQ